MPGCAALISQADNSGVTEVGWTVVPFATLALAGAGERAAGSTVTVSFTLPRPSAEDLARGYLEIEDALTLVARSNVDWVILVRTPDPDLGRSYDGSYTKPLSDFQLRVAGGDFLTISNADQTLSRGRRGEHELAIDYRVLLHPECYRPGDYGLKLIYTITCE